MNKLKSKVKAQPTTVKNLLWQKGASLLAMSPYGLTPMPSAAERAMADALEAAYLETQAARLAAR